MPQDTGPFPADLVDWVNARWSNDMGAIDGYDIVFIAALLARASPRNILEIGCASGFSTAVLAMLTRGNPAVRLNSFDMLDHFYAQPEKPLGYLTQELPEADRARITLHRGTMSFDAGHHAGSQKYDFAFIDANHVHPWPIIDTLAILPHMAPGSYVVHHDLQMYYGSGDYPHACGPKVLLDQLPEDMRVRYRPVVRGRSTEGMKTRAIDNNIFALKVPADISPLVWSLAQGLYLPWETRAVAGMDGPLVAQLRDAWARTDMPPVVKAFDIGVARYAPFAEGSEPAQKSLAQRLIKRLGRGQG